MTAWTRERIIRDIVRRDAEGLPLSLSINNHGVELSLYQAASRIFGSWKNAVVAAGLPVSRSRTKSEWTPARIRKVIRSLSHRKQPLGTRELKERYGYFLTAARRHFGSWSKAVIAAGIDPQRMKRTPSWSKDRVIECILKLALRDENLQRRFVQPRAFVEAGTRLFGSWKAALSAAGVDPHISRTTSTAEHLPPMAIDVRAMARDSNHEASNPRQRRPRTRWTNNVILEWVRHRVRENKLLYATAVYSENRALYRAAKRSFGSWKKTLLAAGLEPGQHRKVKRASDPNHLLTTLVGDKLEPDSKDAHGKSTAPVR